MCFPPWHRPGWVQTGRRGAAAGSRTQTPKERATISITTNAAEQRLHGWALSDGSRLVNPRQFGPNELKLNQWVAVDGHAFRIINMRAVGMTGRMVELSRHAPVYVPAGDTLTGFDVAPPPPEGFPTAPAPDPPPTARPKRRRAAPGAGPTAPGRR